MFFQFDISSTCHPVPETTVPADAGTPELLRKLIELQSEQLKCLRQFVAAHDHAARWRSFVSRWREDFPDLSSNCRQAVPILERTFNKLIAELTEHLCQNGSDALDNEFALQEFLDRYGMRAGQLATLMNLVGPLAEHGSPSGSA